MNAPNAQLKYWRILHELRCGPHRTDRLTKAIHVLQIYQAATGRKNTYCVLFECILGYQTKIDRRDRKFYVSVTRARREVHIFYSGFV